MAKLAALALVGLSEGRLLKTNSTVKITSDQYVKIDGADVYSQSAGHSMLGQCSSFSASTIDDPTTPVVKVCGTQTKVTVYLRNRCEDYHHYIETIGVCNPSMDPKSCMEKGPASVQWMMTAQSYRIEQCATGTQR